MVTHEHVGMMPPMCPRKPLTEPTRILIVNPNTNGIVTERIRAVAAWLAEPELTIDVINPVKGPHSIVSEQDRQRAEQSVLSLLEEKQHEGYSAYLLACFDDLALAQARRLLSAPVIGTCEPSIHAAQQISERFSVVTTVHEAVPGIESLLRQHRAYLACSVRASGVGVAAAAAAMPDAVEKIRLTAEAAVHEDGAQAILLASGGLSGYGPLIARGLTVPVIDGVEVAIRKTLAVAWQMRA